MDFWETAFSDKPTSTNDCTNHGTDGYSGTDCYNLLVREKRRVAGWVGNGVAGMIINKLLIVSQDHSLISTR